MSPWPPPSSWRRTIVVALVVYWHPELILIGRQRRDRGVVRGHVFSGRERRSADQDRATDWTMFGFYIRNNIGVAFQCFAGGLFTGLGTLFFLAYNGVFSGAVAGYLAQRGLSPTFFSFIATHSAFELTAIVLSGAAGLRIGHALIAPGRMRRREALVRATEETATLLYGIRSCSSPPRVSKRSGPPRPGYRRAEICGRGPSAGPRSSCISRVRAAMQVDTLAVLRPRTTMEAADLGGRGCRQQRARCIPHIWRSRCQ